MRMFSLLLLVLLWAPSIDAENVSYDPMVERDYDCDPACATCRGPSPDSNSCVTCLDGSNATEIFPGAGIGFCGPSCPLCFGGAMPSNPGASYVVADNDLRQDCGRENALSHHGGSPALENWECAYLQAQTYRGCGCPELPPLPSDLEPACTLCADGSEPQNPDAVVVFEWQEVTCGDLVESFAHRETTYPGSCTELQYALRNECGCPKPEPLPDTCTLCYDGSEISEDYSDAFIPYSIKDDIFGESTCGEIQESLNFKYVNDWSCTITIHQMGAEYCGCPDIPTEAPTSIDNSSAAHYPAHLRTMVAVALSLLSVLL